MSGVQKVLIDPIYKTVKNRWGVHKVRHGHDRVYVNGVLAGHVPHAGDFKGVFHPVPGFPQEWCQDVMDKSGGAITRCNKVPIVAEANKQPLLVDEFEGDDDE